MTKHCPEILTGATSQEIQANFIEMLQSISRALQSTDQGKCRICERIFTVMDLAGGTCEQCKMNDEERW